MPIQTSFMNDGLEILSVNIRIVYALQRFSGRPYLFNSINCNIKTVLLNPCRMNHLEKHTVIITLQVGYHSSKPLEKAVHCFHKTIVMVLSGQQGGRSCENIYNIYNIF